MNLVGLPICLANAELQKMDNWMRINKLFLNNKKNTFMIIKSMWPKTSNIIFN